MTEMTQFETEILAVLRQIASSLKSLEKSTPPKLNHVRLLTDYKGFDWSSIGATVIQADREGATHVTVAGNVYTRRAPKEQFGAAIIYSRGTGKDQTGTQTYERLIAFKPLPEAGAVSEKSKQVLGAKSTTPTPSGTGLQPGDAAAATTKMASVGHSISKPGNGTAPSTNQVPGHPVPHQMYVKIASGLSFQPEAYDKIAELAGVTDKGDDYAKVLPYLDLFVEARKGKMKWSQVVDLIKINNGSASMALAAISQDIGDF